MSDAAIANIVTGVVTITTLIVGFLTLWTKLRYGVEKVDEAAVKAKVVEEKIDDNTAITRAGSIAAARTAVEVKNALAATEHVTQTIDKKLNGGIDDAVRKSMEPVYKMLSDHSERIDNIHKYAHDRNHEILDALQTQTDKLEVVLTILKQQKLA